MPCYATGSAEGDALLDAQAARKDATAATRVACELLKYLRSNTMLDESNLTNGTRTWIKNHDLIDRLQTEKEEKLHKRLRLRDAALAKLSPEEKRALGL